MSDDNIIHFNPWRDFNDAAIPLGAAMFCELTQRKLPRGVA